MCVSPGRVKGILRLYRPHIRYGRKDIVLLNEWVTSGVVFLKNAGGLLSTTGGLTSHASLIAREYRLPCLVSVRGLDEIKEGTPVLLDATREEIKLV
jgi:phosphoenolpyruvate-protein kinase (PTS system EI component)